jgi:hypothetical protein
MIPQKEMVDHREHIRYRVPKDSFIAIGSDEPILGQIIDISMGGIAFRYMDSKKPTDELHLHIFLTEGDMSLGQVPIKAVSDHEIPNTVLYKTVDEIQNYAAMWCAVWGPDAAPGIAAATLHPEPHHRYCLDFTHSILKELTQSQ